MSRPNPLAKSNTEKINFSQIIRTTLLLFIVLLCITGVIYPLLITGLAQGMFPYQANGSQIVINGKVVGSELIGQPFNGTQYFWGRLSATPDFPYNANNSAGSNLGPDDPSLNASIQARIDALHAADPTNNATIPEDLVTSSASGLDPDISVAAALYQVRKNRTGKKFNGE